jgi:hypothetical protein
MRISRVFLSLSLSFSSGIPAFTCKRINSRASGFSGAHQSRLVFSSEEHFIEGMDYVHQF